MGYPSMNTSLQTTAYNVSPCADRRGNRSVKYIVVHNTGTTASAKNNCQYFRTGNRDASADYFIDTDGSIWKYNGNCAGFYSWHCGDGGGAYGITNYNSIGIEVVSAGTAFTSAQITSLNKLVRAIAEDYGVSLSNVVRHYDASRKSCPSYYVNNTRWNDLKSKITKSTTSSSSSTFKPASSSVIYRIRKSWSDAKSQIGAYKDLTNAKKACDKAGSAYKVFDNNGDVVYPVKSINYKVKITADILNVRKGAGTNYAIATTVKNGEVYTIVGEKKNGNTTWLQLKSGAGYICADYTKRI